MSAAADDDFEIRPADGPSREDLSRRAEPMAPFSPPPAAIAPRPQFGVGDVMVGVAAGLAGGTWMSADIFAAILGLVTLLGLLAVHLYPPESHLGKLLWGTLVLAYVVAVAAALCQPLVR
jgi:hypothetical protein